MNLFFTNNNIIY